MRKSRTDLRTLCRIQAGVGGVLTIFYFSLASFFAVHSKALEAAQKAPCTLEGILRVPAGRFVGHPGSRQACWQCEDRSTTR